MKQVRGRLAGAPLTLPARMHPLARSELAPEEQRARILRAHERLADLNERNRAEFDPLIEALRREAGAERGTDTDRD